MGKKRGFSSKRKRKYNKVYRKESLIAADTTTPQHLIVSVPVTKLQSTMARFLVLRNALKTATLPAGWMQVPAVTEIALCHILLLKKPTISHNIYTKRLLIYCFHIQQHWCFFANHFYN